MGRLHSSFNYGRSERITARLGEKDSGDLRAELRMLGAVDWSDTVGNAGYDGSFRQTIGSTFRMVVDVGNWDATQAMNAPGQSGDPRSAHYGDLFPAWVAGDSFPLLYSRAAVEAHAETRIRLRPAAPPGAPSP